MMLPVGMTYHSASVQDIIMNLYILLEQDVQGGVYSVQPNNPVSTIEFSKLAIESHKLCPDLCSCQIHSHVLVENAPGPKHEEQLFGRLLV